MKFVKGNLCSEAIHIYQLPSEVISIILRYLDARSLVNASHVCHYWSTICNKDLVLRRTIRKQEKRRKRLRWCRAKYGDGFVKSDKFYRGSREIILKRKFRMAQFKFLMTLINLRNMWQGFYDTLLALPQ